MPDTALITVDWVDETQTCILWTFQGAWTGEDYFLSLKQMWALMDSANKPVDILMDMRISGIHPSNLVILIQAAIRRVGCNVRQIVVVSPADFWEGIYTLICQINSAASCLNVEFAATLDEAQEILAQVGLSQSRT